MNKHSQTMLAKSPRPLPWTIVIFALGVAVAVTHSVLIGIALGLTIGSYFGNYRGRLAVLAAWQVDLDAEYKQLRTERDSEYQQAS